MEAESNVEYVEVFQAKDEEWYWRGVAGNGEIVCTSEGYTRSADAERAADATFPEILIRHV